MRAVRAALVLLFLGTLAAPEIRRYDAERNLRASEAAFDLVMKQYSQIRNPVEVLGRIADRAAEVARRIPGDSRGWVLAGSARLVAGDGERAIGFYREALARGERAEIHLNLGRAYSLQGDNASAHAAFLRAAWLSPALMRAVPDSFAEPVAEAEP